MTNVVAIAAGKAHSLALMGTPEQLGGRTRFMNPRWNNQTLAVSLPTERGRSSVLEWTASLSEPEWTLTPPIPGDGSAKELSLSTTNAVQRFYRVRLAR